MRPINHVLHVFTGKLMVVYFDDILIYNKNLNEHFNHLCSVLNVLRSEKLYVNLNIFAWRKLCFLNIL
jgi:hypothetical protein